MLTPEYLRDLPEAILRLYQEAELRILADMVRRLAAYDYWIPAAEHQKRALQEAGRTHEEIVDALAKITGKSSQELRQMMQEAGTKALESDAAEYISAGLEPPSIRDSKRLRDTLNAGYKATQGTMRNLAKTTAKPPHSSSSELWTVLGWTFGAAQSTTTQQSAVPSKIYPRVACNPSATLLATLIAWRWPSAGLW